MKMPHTATHRGKRVLIIFKDGSRIEGKFHTRTDRDVIIRTENGLERFGKSLIQSFITLPKIKRKQ